MLNRLLCTGGGNCVVSMITHPFKKDPDYFKWGSSNIMSSFPCYQIIWITLWSCVRWYHHYIIVEWNKWISRQLGCLLLYPKGKLKLTKLNNSVKGKVFWNSSTINQLQMFFLSAIIWFVHLIWCSLSQIWFIAGELVYLVSSHLTVYRPLCALFYSC